MYQNYFSLNEAPFESSINYRFYYVGSAQRQALELLEETLHNSSGNICVLTGHSGCGKTTLLRMLMRSLPENMRLIAIDDPRLDAQMLLATILRASGVNAASFESIAELTLKLREMLERQLAQGRITTVLIDEAQGLSDEVLEQIRLISNIEGKAGKMINFLLAGQEDLVANLKKNEHKMLLNRVKIFAHLPFFKKDDVQAYVNYRLSKAGSVDMIFTNKAIAALTKKSQGTARLINSIADKALFLCYKARREHVSAAMVNKAASIVHNRKFGLMQALNKGIKSMLSFAFAAKSMLVLLALVLTVLGFVATQLIVQQIKPEQEMISKLMDNSDVEKSYNFLLNEIYRGRVEHNVMQQLFKRSIEKAWFKDEAVNTLVALQGYARADGELATCKSLRSLALECSIRQGKAQDLLRFNIPALVYMNDEQLNPYFAVLLKLDQKHAQLIIDKHLFELKREYFDKYFLNEYLLIHARLPRINRNYLSQHMIDFLRPRLNYYLQRKGISLERLNNESTALKIERYLKIVKRSQLREDDLIFLDSLLSTRHLKD